MGIMCCSEQNDHFSTTKEIYQIRQSNNIYLESYDITNQVFSKEIINLRILNDIKGISQINISNSLYLCGNNKIEETKTSTSSSYLFKIRKKETTILINSRFCHYHPSLCVYEDVCLGTTLLVIGGKHQTKCEKYSIRHNHWKNLAELPEEKYGCSLMTDKNEDFLYLFGGEKQMKNPIRHIYRLNLLISSAFWEKISIKNHENLTFKINSIAFRGHNSNVIYILGGSSNDDDNDHFFRVNSGIGLSMMDGKFDVDKYININNNKAVSCSCDVYEFNCIENVLQKSNVSIRKKTSFINFSGVDINNTEFYFFDKFGDVIMLNSKSQNVEIITNFN